MELTLRQPGFLVDREDATKAKPRTGVPTRAGYAWVKDPSVKGGGFWRKLPKGSAGVGGAIAKGVVAAAAVGAAGYAAHRSGALGKAVSTIEKKHGKFANATAKKLAPHVNKLENAIKGENPDNRKKRNLAIAGAVGGTGVLIGADRLAKKAREKAAREKEQQQQSQRTQETPPPPNQGQQKTEREQRQERSRQAWEEYTNWERESGNPAREAQAKKEQEFERKHNVGRNANAGQSQQQAQNKQAPEPEEQRKKRWEEAQQRQKQREQEYANREAETEKRWKEGRERRQQERQQNGGQTNEEEARQRRKAEASVGSKWQDILGVDKDASPAEIKKAYRSAAAKNHPDKGGDKEAMTKINEAYDFWKKYKKGDAFDLIEFAYWQAQQYHSYMKPDFWNV